MKYLLLIFISVFLCPPWSKAEKDLQASVSALFPDTARPGNDMGLLSPWQLLVDDYLIEKKENVQRVYHPFTKNRQNPVLVADKPWEGRMIYVYGTVLPGEKGKGYRIWYHSWNHEYRNLYATSKDGLTWEKPDLGIIGYNGSKANNIFFRRTKEDHLPQVIYTPWEKDPNRRYKLLNYDYGRTKPDHLVSGFWGAYSPDGIHWTDVVHNPVLKDPGDVGNFVWDGHARRYIGYPKIFAPVRGYNRRCVGFSATKDFEHWPSTQLILAPDEADDRWASLKNQRTEFYGLSGFPYASGYIGFLWIFHITDGANDGPIYCELVSSRDGISWVREQVVNGERKPILPVGPKGAWDQGMVFTPNHPLMDKDTIKLWYGGSGVTHGSDDDSARSSIGLATLRKDGFASVDAGEAVGTVTTKPLKNLRGLLFVNANARAGSLKVEVLTENGKVLSGFSSGECNVIHDDGTSLQISWQKHKRLPGTHEAFRLRFILENASLYSFMGGKGVDLFYPARAQGIRPGFEKEKNEFPESRSYRLIGNVIIEKDPAGVSGNKEVARFPADRLQQAKIELLHTDQPGDRFTLEAVIKTTNDKQMRLFGNYRGTGEPVSGELLFDFDPSGSQNPGLRFIANGQTVQSKPLKFDDGRAHQLAVTYDRGKVILYLDAAVVGRGQLKYGSTHLSTDGTVRPYFEQPEALPEVGIRLAGNLYVGGDVDERFVNYKDEITPLPRAQFAGLVEGVHIEYKVLTASEIQNLFGREIR